MAWSGGCTAVIWLIGKACGVIRSQLHEEILGLDYVKHVGTLEKSECDYI